MADPITFRVSGLPETIAYFQLLANDQFPFAQSKACNDLAFLVRDAEMQTMRDVFDRPKEQTIRNIRVFKGNKTRPGATVAFQQIYEGDEYMVAQVEGGQRPMKRSEKAFGHYYVPGIGARLDQYGNMVPGQITQILSSLQLMKENGYSANRRTKVAKSGVQYFMLQQKTHGLVPGIYTRVDKGMGQMVVAQALANKPRGTTRAAIKEKYSKALQRGVIPVIIFISKPPAYKKRFPFFEVANRVIEVNYQRVMGEAVDFALRTAR